MKPENVKKPTLSQLRDVAAELGFSFSEREFAEHLAILVSSTEAYEQLDRMTDAMPEVRYPRTPGYRPTADESRRDVPKTGGQRRKRFCSHARQRLWF